MKRTRDRIRRFIRQISFAYVVVLALTVVTVCAVVAVGFLYSVQRSQYQDHSQTSADNAALSHYARCSEVADSERIQCYADTPQPEYNRERAEQLAEIDAYSQRTMALWTAALGAVGVLSLPISFIGIALLMQTLRETRNIAKADHRATMHVVEASVVGGKEAGTRRFLLKLEKNGSAMISDVYFDGQVGFWAHSEGTPLAGYGFHVSTDIIEVPKSGQFIVITLGAKQTREILNDIADAEIVSANVIGYLNFTNVFNEPEDTIVSFSGEVSNDFVGKIGRPKRIGGKERDRRMG